MPPSFDGGPLRRWSLLWLALAWLPALAGTPAPATLPADAATTLSASSSTRFETPRTAGLQVAPESAERIGNGPSAGPARSSRSARASLRFTLPEVSDAAALSRARSRLAWARGVDRTRTGFLTSSSSTAPPPLAHV